MYGSRLNIGWFRCFDGVFDLPKEIRQFSEVSLGLLGIFMW